MKLFVMIVAAIALGACGNTISGVGQDVQWMGDKVSNWQNPNPKVDKVDKNVKK